MRKLFFGISTFISCVSFAQNDIQTAVFPDGTEVDYQVFSNEIKDMEKLNVFLEINTRSTLTLGPSVSYTLPEVFISKVLRNNLVQDWAIYQEITKRMVFLELMQKQTNYH